MALPSFAATCKISEYRVIIKDQAEVQVMVAQEPAVTTQTVTYTSSAQSAVFNEGTSFVRIICDAKAHFVFGTNPTATANSPYVAADSAEYFGLPRNAADTLKVAFYDGST
jgi:hypothetical protein